MSIESRRDALRNLEETRGGSRVIAYLTSTRPGAEGQLAQDAIPRIYKHLLAIPTRPADTTIDLFLHSFGGDSSVPWQLVSLIRQYCAEFNVIVPSYAFSAATSTALGADNVYMHPMGVLGPIDPSINSPLNPPHPFVQGQALPVSVEDVASFIRLVKDDVGIRHEDELVKAFLALADKVHPLTLGNVKRSTSQARMLAEKLLKRRNIGAPQPTDIDEVVARLTTESHYHGHPINCREARQDIGLSFVQETSEELSKSVWSLFELYSDDFMLDQPFNVLQEAISLSPLSPPAPGVPIPASTTVTLPSLAFVIVESVNRSDFFEQSAQLTIMRDGLGNYTSGQIQVTKTQWRSEVPPAGSSSAAGENVTSDAESNGPPGGSSGSAQEFEAGEGD
jgi:hypothetical protein